MTYFIENDYTGGWYAVDTTARLRWRVNPEDWSAAQRRQWQRRADGWRKHVTREELLGWRPPVATAEDYARIYSKRSPQKDG
jgi:hypothetical protein